MEMVDITHCLIISKSIGILFSLHLKSCNMRKCFMLVSLLLDAVVLDLVGTHCHWLYISILLNCKCIIALKKYRKFWSTIIDFRSVFSVQRIIILWWEFKCVAQNQP
jgi:hypothetical protein